MSTDLAALYGHIRQTVLDHVDTSAAGRREALRDVLAAAMPLLDRDSADALAVRVPPLMPSLYEKWVHLFAKRLFETVPVEQIELLCDGAADNDAALVLAFLMFLESERMERQIAEDLRRYAPDPALCDAVRAGLDQSLAQARDRAGKAARAKAALYRSGRRGESSAG